MNTLFYFSVTSSQNSNSGNLEKVHKYLSYNTNFATSNGSMGDYFRNDTRKETSHLLGQGQYRLLRFDSVGNSNETHRSSSLKENSDFYKSSSYSNSKPPNPVDDAEDDNTSSLSSNDSHLSETADAQNQNNDEHYDEEFQVILGQITIRDGKIFTKKSQMGVGNGDYALATRTSSQIDDNNLNPTSITVTTLKYLFKLLRFYKLEHYMSDLIEHGYHTPISLHKLKQNDLDAFNVSPYDKKKFLKLQLFIKQLVTTISKSKNSNATTNGARESRKVGGAKEVELDEKVYSKYEEFSNEPVGAKVSLAKKATTNSLVNAQKSGRLWTSANRDEMPTKDFNNNLRDHRRSDVHDGANDDEDYDDDPSSYVNFKPKSMANSNLPLEISMIPKFDFM